MPAAIIPDDGVFEVECGDDAGEVSFGVGEVEGDGGAGADSDGFGAEVGDGEAGCGLNPAVGDNFADGHAAGGEVFEDVVTCFIYVGIGVVVLGAGVWFVIIELAVVVEVGIDDDTGEAGFV